MTTIVRRLGVVLLFISLVNGVAAIYTSDLQEQTELPIACFIGVVAGIAMIKHWRFWAILAIFAAVTYLGLLSRVVIELVFISSSVSAFLSTWSLPLSDPRVPISISLRLLWFYLLLPIFYSALALFSVVKILNGLISRARKHAA
jgi:hypothetical protein